MHPTKLDDVDAVLPKDVLETLDTLTDGKAILTTEVGQHQMWTAEYYNFKSQRSLATSGGFGTMGYGLGASIGAKVGNPDRTVVNVAGDGSFYMNLTELSTLARYDIPVIELVFNNSVLGMVRQWQRLFYGKRFSQTVIDKGTDFVKLGESFGVKSLRITKKSDIEPVLKEALSCGKPCLIDCWIDKDINVLPMVPAGASVYEPIMDIVIDD
jgi:acetolactate synthase-1/2/3 large subunit